MDWKIWDALFVVLLFNILIGLSSGGSVVVVGGGSDKNGALPTTYSGLSSLSSSRDPSQYEPPNLPDSVYSSTSSSSSSSSTDNETSSGHSPRLNFSMTSKVVGSSTNHGRGAGFSEWRVLEGDNGFNAKQSSNALYGNLDENRIIKFNKNSAAADTDAGETYTFKYAAMLLQDQVRFLGNSYNDRVNYFNKGELISNSFTTGAISKNSTYIGAFVNYNLSEGSASKLGYFRKTTKFYLDSKNVGIANLDLITGSEDNSTEISEQYS